MFLNLHSNYTKIILKKLQKYICSSKFDVSLTLFQILNLKMFEVKYPMLNQWIVYRFDKLNYQNISQRRINIQTSKFILVCLFSIFYICHNLFLYNLHYKRPPLYYFGFVHLCGGIPELFNLMASFGQLFALNSIYILFVLSLICLP